MSEFFKSKKKFGLALGAVFLALTLVTGSFAYVNRDLAVTASAATAGRSEAESGSAPGREAPPEAEPEEEAPLTGEEPDPVSFNAPAEMRGTFLVPGVDFVKTKDTTEATIKAEIDAALAAAKGLTINAVIVDTVYSDQVIYSTTDAPELSPNFDIMAYIVERAREEDFYTYAIFDASMYKSRSGLSTALAVGAGARDKLTANLDEFAVKYDLDGILIDGYANEAAEGTYASYLSTGGGIGFDNFMRQSPTSVVKSASKAIRKSAPGTMVGLLADAVWANQSENEAGSATAAGYTSLNGGNADTKGFVERGYVDFVAVKAYTTTTSQSEPFEAVVSWWADVARDNDIPMYVVHATDKLFTGEAGWGSSDQLILQLAEVEGTGGARGSIFNNLQTVASGAQNVTDNVKKLYEGEVEPEQILTKLEMTRPVETTFTTSAPQATFTGASDPGQPVTINGKEIETDNSGYFTEQMALKAGLNTFVVKHKDQEITYNITRKIEVLKSISPVEDIVTDGGMTITITAEAYEEADVYAVVGGTTVTMEMDDSMESEQDRDGFFRPFIGEYTAPAATGEEQSIGKITVHAEYDGESASMTGGSVTVNKKAKLEDGVAVRVVTDQALTYPPDTLNNIPDPRYYPLPAGAMDYAVGDEIVYSKDGKTYTYLVLASGMRVESKDVTPIEDDYPSNNAVTGLSVKTEDGFTYVTLKTAQKVTYSVEYQSGRISYKFHNTTRTPDDTKLTKNPLFSSAKWSDSTLTLTYVKENTFWGYKGYYDNNGNLVLRFKNPPGSLAGARIAIDPGHGGADKGASGFLADYPESVINSAVAKALAKELESRGATVLLMNNAGIEREQRKLAAEKLNPDLFVSIHSNSAPNVKATGTEVFYFQPYSKTLAANVSKNVASGLSTNNRGAKYSYYHVALSSQMPSVLVECGFLTNVDEYNKLIKSSYQKKIATGIADALSQTIKSKNTGVDASGSESVGASAEPGTASSSSSGSGSSSSSSGVPLEDLYIKATASVTVGKTTVLVPTFYPEEINNAPVTWKSRDTSIAKVDENGKVTGVKAGKVNIVVTSAEDSSLSTVCEVTVKAAGSKEVSVTGVELDSDNITVVAGETYQLRAEVQPDDADNTEVTWKSNKTGVATVSETGKVTGVKEGSATITVTTNDGKYKATCDVTVAAAGAGRADDSGVRLSTARNVQQEEAYVDINPGSAMRLEALTENWDLIRGGDFTWKSDDTSVVTVDKMGNITAKKVGEAYVTATAKGHDTLEWYINVTRDKVSLTDIGLNERDLELVKGETYNLRAIFYPSSVTNRGVRWSSDNERIAKVDSNGKVTAVNPGTTTITVRSRENSKLIKTCEVVVLSSSASGKGKVEEFYILDENGFDAVELYYAVGESGALDFETYPSDASASGVKWESKTPGVVKIDSETGEFECLKRGSATITLTQSGSSARATCRIVVG